METWVDFPAERRMALNSIAFYIVALAPLAVGCVELKPNERLPEVVDPDASEPDVSAVFDLGFVADAAAEEDARAGLAGCGAGLRCIR